MSNINLWKFYFNYYFKNNKIKKYKFKNNKFKPYKALLTLFLKYFFKKYKLLLFVIVFPIIVSIIFLLNRKNTTENLFNQTWWLSKLFFINFLINLYIVYSYSEFRHNLLFKKICYINFINKYKFFLLFFSFFFIFSTIIYILNFSFFFGYPSFIETMKNKKINYIHLFFAFLFSILINVLISLIIATLPLKSKIIIIIFFLYFVFVQSFPTIWAFLYYKNPSFVKKFYDYLFWILPSKSVDHLFLQTYIVPKTNVIKLEESIFKIPIYVNYLVSFFWVVILTIINFLLIKWKWISNIIFNK